MAFNSNGDPAAAVDSLRQSICIGETGERTVILLIPNSPDAQLTLMPGDAVTFSQQPNSPPVRFSKHHPLT